MAQTVWHVRKPGKAYGPGMNTDVEKASPHPFDEFVGENAPPDVEVIRRVQFDVPKYATEGWVPHISQREYNEMYGGGDAGGGG